MISVSSLLKNSAQIEFANTDGTVGMYINVKAVKLEQQHNSIDAVEVVRCENCQFWDNEHISSEGLAKCVTGESGIRYRRSYDFCSHGERKDENG